jgi:hypothetical protein
MVDKTEGIFNLTAPVIMIHPGLFEARAVGLKGQATGKLKFSASFMLKPEHPDLNALKELCAKVAKGRWPGRDLKELKFPLASGDKQADKAKSKSKDAEFQRGFIVLTARSQYQPRLAMIDGSRIVDLEGPAILANKEKFFFGAEVLGQFNFASYQGVGDNPDGVNAYLNLVLVTGKGKRIGGTAASAAEVFKGYMGSHSAEDPTAGTDEGISF